MKSTGFRGALYLFAGATMWLIASPVATAAYMLVDDFESYTEATFSGGSTASAYNAPAGPWFTSNQGNTSLVAVQNDGDRYLAWNWGGSGNRNPNRTVPATADGDSGTYYFQITNNAPNSDVSDFSVGLSDVVAGGTGFDQFGTFEAQVAMTYDAAGNGLRIGVRNGATFVNDLVTNLSFSTWYDVWIVVDNAADTYDVYFGQTGDPNVLGTLIADDYAFRNSGAGNVGDLVTFLGIENQGGADRSLGIDNIFYNNVAVPEPSSVMAVFGLVAGIALARRRTA